MLAVLPGPALAQLTAVPANGVESRKLLVTEPAVPGHDPEQVEVSGGPPADGGHHR